MSEKEKFRSPVAVVTWWLWILFAIGNLADLAVQGRDHLSVVAAFVLLFITGVVYVTAQRPKIVADAEGLTLTNPVRVHRVGWAAVAGIDATDLLRIRCEWPEGDEGQVARRVIYSWAVHASRRREAAAQLRARRQAQRSGRGGSRGPAGPSGAFGGGLSAGNAPSPAPIGLDAMRIVATLSERSAAAKTAEPNAPAVPPVSAWQWPAIAVVVVPALALLVVVLA